MTNIDPFLVATRESQGQPVDAVGRPDLIERLRRSAKADLGSLTYAGLGHTALEAATALAEKDARIAELEAELIQSRNFWSEELSAKNTELTASRAECEGLRAALEAAKNWLEYENSPMGAAEEAAYWRLRAKIDVALSQKETGDAA